MSEDWVARITPLAGSWPGNSLLSLVQAVRCIEELRASGEARLVDMAATIHRQERDRLDRLRAAWERTGPHDGEYEAIFAYLSSALEES